MQKFPHLVSAHSIARPPKKARRKSKKFYTARGAAFDSSRELKICSQKAGAFCFLFLCPHEESNLELLLRRESFYPLNYGGKGQFIVVCPGSAKRKLSMPSEARRTTGGTNDNILLWIGC